MSSRIALAKEKKLIAPPKWLPANVQYEVITGSVAYAASNDTSDMDIAGWCIPPKNMIFPHLTGYIRGFGPAPEDFSDYTQHHVKDPEARKEYDFTIYSIVKFFNLCAGNNPNMLDTLFTPQRCVLHCTKIAQMVRDKRKLFLHKGCYDKFRGYASSQISKIEHKRNASNPKRAALIEKFGYDTKFAANVPRLMLECEQILMEGDLNIEKNGALIRSIREGEWTIERLKNWFESKERAMEALVLESKLRAVPAMEEIKLLLIECLEEHYGSLGEAVRVELPVERLVRELDAVLIGYR